MEFNVTNNKNWHTVIDVTIAADKVKPELDNNYRQYQSHAKVGGFRQGKVPMSLIKKMFGEEIKHETFRPFISEASQEIFKDKELDNLINEPMITNLKFDDTAGLTFNIEYDVRPEFTINDFKGLPLEKTEYKIDKQDVDNMLSDLQQRNAMIHTVDGEAKEEHYLLADLQELDASGIPVVGHKFEGQQIWLSKENTELLSQLAGIKSGEERNITLTMKDENDENAQETRQQFLVQVKEVKERRVPELDDEFAKDVGPYKTLKELKKNLENNLKQQAEMETRVHFETTVKNELIKHADVEAPPSMVDNYLGALISDYKKRKEGNKVTDEQLMEYYGPIAVRNIKWMLVREQLIKQEELKITDEQVEAKIAELEKSENEHDVQHAQRYKESEEEREGLKDRMFEDKVMELVVSKAKIEKNTKMWRDMYAGNEENKDDTGEENND